MDFSEKANRFIGWLKECGAFVSESISLYDYSHEDMGTGVRANDYIKRETVLFRIPRFLLINRHSSPKSKEIKKNVGNDGWSQAIWTVILERRNESSLWRPYFNMLPRSISTPMSWAESEKVSLEGSFIYDSINDDRLFEEFVANASIQFNECYGPTEEEYFFAGDLLSCYSFLEGGKSPTEVSIVPLADMLNHSSSLNNARLFYARDCLEMVAIKDIGKDEQIFNTFGALGNSELLLKYGFIEGEENMYNCVKIYISELFGYLEGIKGDEQTKYLEKLLDDGRIKTEEFKLTLKTDAGLSKLFCKLKMPFKDFLIWRLSKYPGRTVCSSDSTNHHQKALRVCAQEQRIIRHHLNYDK